MVRGAMKHCIALLAAMLIGLLARSARAEVPIPPYERYCNDLAGKLTAEERDDLEKRLEAYNKATPNEIAVIIVRSLDGEPIEDFAYRVAKAWKVGAKGKDTGVLIAVSLAERRFRIEVGKGL